VTTTLLAVDDSVTMRKVLEITFSGEQYKTVLASNGQEAIGLAKSERPAIVLIDHTLPDGSGYDLAQQVKSAVPGVAVMILSSKQSPYDKARGQASGVDDFMDKPFDTQKFLDKVAQVLSQPRAAHVAAPQPQAAPAPVAPVAAASPAAGPAAARARPQTLAYGTPSPQPPVAPAPAAAPQPTAPSRTLPGTPAATPKPAMAQTRPAAQPAAVAAPPPAVAPARVQAVAAAAHAATGNGQLTTKLESLGLTPEQVQGVLALSREVVEQIVWEVVPVLAETIIKEEIRRLTSE
jgi:CheY-like chemotaxis protein